MGTVGVVNGVGVESGFSAGVVELAVGLLEVTEIMGVGEGWTLVGIETLSVVEGIEVAKGVAFGPQAVTMKVSIKLDTMSGFIIASPVRNHGKIVVGALSLLLPEEVIL